jgi:hypothetical protein
VAKPSQTSFTEEFEPILLAAWGGVGDQLSESQLDQTRRVVVELRRIYRFRDTPVNKVRFDVKKNAAGYLAAFGQRHAYLTYEHLKQVSQMSPSSIPNPDSRGELTVTVLGAGAAVEVYGLCLFYNEFSHRLKRLRLNLVEKVDEWKPTRQTVLGRLLKSKFPRLSVFPQDVDMDLATEDGVHKLAFHHDHLVKSNIVLIYNVLNEIRVEQASKVWRNLKYILRQNENPLLVLLAEPNAPKARPRVNWLENRLAECSQLIMLEQDAHVRFEHEPVKIELEGTGVGLNDRLFGRSVDGSRPTLQTSITRTMMAAKITPFSPVSAELVEQQFRMVTIKRAKKGRFARREASADRQVNRNGLIEEPMLLGWDEPPLFEGLR